MAHHLEQREHFLIVRTFNSSQCWFTAFSTENEKSDCKSVMKYAADPAMALEEVEKLLC